MTWEINILSILQKLPKLENRILTVRIPCSEEQAKNVIGQPLVSAQKIRHVTHRSPLWSQQKPGIKMGLSRKYLWRILLSNGTVAYDMHRRATRFLRMFY